MRLPNVPRIPVVHGLKLFVSARLFAHWDGLGGIKWGDGDHLVHIIIK